VARLEVPDPGRPLALLHPGGAEVTAITDPAARPPSSAPLVYHALAPFVSMDGALPQRLAPLSNVWPRWSRASDVALVVTVYDLIPLRFPRAYHYTPSARNAYEMRAELLRRADAVLAISSSARDDAIELARVDPERVHVVGAASPLELSTRAQDDATPDWLVGDVAEAPIVTVTGEDARKNNERLVEAYVGLPAGLRRSHRLVVVGVLSEITMARLRSIAGAGGASGDVVLAGEVSDEVLMRLYEGAALVAFPSLAEGFGLPILEGLRAGAVVVASDIPSTRELIRDPDARFDPSSTEAIRDALQRGLRDTELRARVCDSAPDWTAQFTWDQVVARSLAAYEEAVERRAHMSRPRGPRSRSRVAIVTPLPPARSGVANYSSRLIGAMRHFARLEVYGEESWRHQPDFNAGGADPPQQDVRPAHHFPWAREFSGSALPALMVLGGSPYHMDAWRLLMRHGGDVLLHDVFLGWLYAWLGALGHLEVNGFQRRARELRVATPDEHFQLGRLMFAEVVDRARRVYVHSQAARRLILTERPARADDVHVVPFGHPTVDPGSPDPERPVIASFGYLKHPERLIEASVPVLKALPNARLWLVGDSPVPDHLATLRRIAHVAGVGERVDVTGWVSPEEYRRRLRATTVAVQLRSRFYGERSAALADLLARGVPTIANDGGSVGELPQDTVLRLGQSPSAHDVTAALFSLIDDPAQHGRIRAAAMRFASENSMDVAAQRLLALIGAAA
jgi:glycosyltransferase involved in cell wall biosynthesis